MGIIQCINNMFGINQEEPGVSRRVSELDEEDLVLVRLNYMKNVLIEKHNECKKAADLNFQLAIKNKSDKSLARIYLQKKKICLNTNKNIDGKIMLIEKQINLIQSAQEDREFINTVKESNSLLRELKNQVDTNELTKAINMIQEGENDQNEINGIMNQLGIEQNDEELERELEALGEKRQENFDNNVEDLLNEKVKEESEVLLS